MLKQLKGTMAEDKAVSTVKHLEGSTKARFNYLLQVFNKSEQGRELRQCAMDREDVTLARMADFLVTEFIGSPLLIRRAQAAFSLRTCYVELMACLVNPTCQKRLNGAQQDATWNQVHSAPQEEPLE